MRINIRVFRSFLSSASAGSVLLAICLAASLIIANSSLAPGFDALLETAVGGFRAVDWINDALMSVFFLLVGLEIKRELVEGELASVKRASLPILAAIGGAVTPALIYAWINRGAPAAAGWGIPMATDIAFALAALSIVGKRIPTSLKVFLSALAIVDDLIAILVIAIFYSAKLDFQYLLAAGGLMAVLIAFNRFGVKSLIFYLIPGVALWFCIHHSGVHATISGVLLALTLPTTPDAAESPLEKLECMLTRPVNLVILPLFALANTAIHFEPQMLAGLRSNLGLGIIIGLVFGKPVGICLTSWIAIRSGIARLPGGAGWPQLTGAAILAGIGFTMSTFIALLSFHDPAMQAEAKCAVLVASVIATIGGLTMLTLVGRRRRLRQAAGH